MGSIPKGVIRPSWISDGTPLPDPAGRAARVLRFMEACHHPKAGGRFALPPFWKRIIQRVYGDVDDEGRLRTREVFVMLPRGARKTTVGAALALIYLCGPERVPGGQVISAASSRDQASIALDEAVGIVEATRELSAALRMRSHLKEIRHAKTGSVYRAISADASGAHGLTPTAVIADELHVWPNDRLWAALRSGTAKAKGSITWIISTAGRGQTGFFWDRFQAAMAARELEESGRVNDTGICPVIFATTDEADWRDPDVWAAVNPGMAHGFPDRDAIAQLAKDAERSLFARASFRQFNLNHWSEAKEDPFVPMHVYDEGSDPIDLEALRDRPCWIGVDLGKSFDMTAIVAAWKDDHGGFIVHPWFFCPADKVDERTAREGIPYRQWVEDGLLIASPGSVIDEALVEEKLREIADTFDVRSIGFDPNFAARLMARLGEDGLPVVEMPQRWSVMGPATRTLQEAIVGRRFRHGGHPILRWNVENIAVVRDKNGDAQMHKGKSRDHIDGAVAAAMAVHQASLADDAPSLYDLLAQNPNLWG